MKHTDSKRGNGWLAAIFDRLDPSRTDPAYWVRFKQSVLARALPELARRRREIPLSLSDVVSSWARTLLPTAAAAAAIGTFLILRPLAAPDDAQGANAAEVGVEELLVSGIEGGTIPATLGGPEPPVGAVTFASDAF